MPDTTVTPLKIAFNRSDSPRLRTYKHRHERLRIAHVEIRMRAVALIDRGIRTGRGIGNLQSDGVLIRDLVAAAHRGLAFAEPRNLPGETHCRPDIAPVLGEQQLVRIRRIRPDELNLRQAAARRVRK